MTYETNITFSCNACESELWLSMFKAFTNQCHQMRVNTMTLFKDWVWSKMCGKHSWIWSKVEHCIKVWYLDSWTCLRQDVHRWLIASHMLQYLVSHSSKCELSCVERMIRMVNNGTNSNMYWCVWFPCLIKRMIKCNICGIMSIVWN